jgi:hypothetical protein
MTCGGNDGLGRRLHPLGTAAVGAAVHCVLEACGAGWRPRGCQVRWRSAIDPGRGFVLRARLGRATAAAIDVATTLHQASALLAEVDVDLQRCATGPCDADAKIASPGRRAPGREGPLG